MKLNDFERNELTEATENTAFTAANTTMQAVVSLVSSLISLIPEADREKFQTLVNSFPGLSEPVKQKAQEATTFAFGRGKSEI